jgi:hypothetical protein
VATCKLEDAKKIPLNTKMRSETCAGIKVLYVKCEYALKSEKIIN